MKVLVLSDYYPPDTKGGADIAAERLSAELARRGHTVRALATTSDPSMAGATTLNGVEVRTHRLQLPAPAAKLRGGLQPGSRGLGRAGDRRSSSRMWSTPTTSTPTIVSGARRARPCTACPSS